MLEPVECEFLFTRGVGGDGGDALCAVPYVWGRGSEVLFAGGAGGNALCAGGAGGDALCADGAEGEALCAALILEAVEGEFCFAGGAEVMLLYWRCKRCWMCWWCRSCWR
jgi:hypothetical protein